MQKTLVLQALVSPSMFKEALKHGAFFKPGKRLKQYCQGRQCKYFFGFEIKKPY
jgi:hypothetical protein